VDISRESRSQAPVRRSTTQQRHLLRFPYTAICRQKKTSTLDPSGAGSQSLRTSLPKHFWQLIGAHVALLNGSQVVRNRRCWVCSNGLRILTEKRRWGGGERCQIIYYDRDNALHGPIARDKTERKPRKPSRRSIVRRLQISSANRIQATLNFNLADLCESGWTL